MVPWPFSSLPMRSGWTWSEGWWRRTFCQRVNFDFEKLQLKTVAAKICSEIGWRCRSDQQFRSLLELLTVQRGIQAGTCPRARLFPMLSPVLTRIAWYDCDIHIYVWCSAVWWVYACTWGDVGHNLWSEMPVSERTCKKRKSDRCWRGNVLHSVTQPFICGDDVNCKFEHAHAYDIIRSAWCADSTSCQIPRFHPHMVVRLSCWLYPSPSNHQQPSSAAPDRHGFCQRECRACDGTCSESRPSFRSQRELLAWLIVVVVLDPIRN